MASLHLSNGLARPIASNFADLLAEACGASLGDTLPYLAPALLFSDAKAQALMGVPQRTPDEVLLHDYQAIRYGAALPLDHPLEVTMQRTGHDYGIDISCDGAPVVRLDTALRIVPRGAVMEVKPTQFRGVERLASLGLTTGLALSQDQVNRYVALSGDTNPIHSDLETAQSLGLEAPIVPGLLLVSCLQPACQSALPKRALTTLKVRFMAPLEVGKRFQIALQDRGAAPEGQRLRACLMTPDAQALAVADMVFQSA